MLIHKKLPKSFSNGCFASFSLSNDFRLESAVYAQQIVQYTDFSVCFRMIKVVTLMFEHSRFAQHDDLVCKSLRNNKKMPVFL